MQYCLFQIGQKDVSGVQSKNSQFSTTGVSAFMDNTYTRVTAGLCIEMRALTAVSIHVEYFNVHKTTHSAATGSGPSRSDHI